MTMTDGDGDYGPAPRRRGMREGYTTGACATAAAKAATLALLTGAPVAQVTIHLPTGRDVTFTLSRCEIGADAARCGVIKDAGDDPDVTHGAEIQATVSFTDAPGVTLAGGVGVGAVTRPGLGLEVGGPAINPVPRRMITEAVLEALAGADRGAQVEIAVPNGAELAKRTLNGRLGIVGGLSILGTTGIVRPYSTASWRASVLQAVDVAAANGLRHIALSTGGRTERYAAALLPDLPEMAFVEMGEFTGAALKRAAARRIERVTLAGMVGKFSKIARGHMMTHVAGNQVEPTFLADLAAAAGAAQDLVTAIAAANTARHAQELAQAAGCHGFFSLVVDGVVAQCAAVVDQRLSVDAVLFDFDGTALAVSAALAEAVAAREARRAG
ncbi:MAG: cobalt-precorrin-5B (C(1))-methyltransferase [Dehalococcoidia bacterium]